MVIRKIGGKAMIFMVDSRAKYSVVTQPVVPLSSQQIQVMGAASIPMEKRFCQNRCVSLEDISSNMNFYICLNALSPCWAETYCQI